MRQGLSRIAGPTVVSPRRGGANGVRFLLCAAVALLSGVLSAAAPAETAIRFEQRIGAQLPLDQTFTDTSGASRRLGDFFHGQPVVLYFGYARCPQLCSVVADGANAALRRLAPSAGRDFQVVTLSLDPTETAAEAKATETLAVRRYGRTGAGAGWHYLTGDAAAIQAVADVAGFHFRYDPRSKQYAHPSGFLIATPTGVVSRYFLGVDFAAGDVASSLRRAAQEKTGDTVFDLLLLCFHGEGIGGRYGALIWRVLATSVVLTVVALAGGVGWMLWQERRDRLDARSP
jgi:protein SCO1